MPQIALRGQVMPPSAIYKTVTFVNFSCNAPPSKLAKATRIPFTEYTHCAIYDGSSNQGTSLHLRKGNPGHACRKDNYGGGRRRKLPSHPALFRRSGRVLTNRGKKSGSRAVFKKTRSPPH